ncbi:purine-nucleoside phosphorylase [Vagococcus elongatus]|uniref:Purine nucleoside phosphorylase n=1 Tax=Vagococcus elongatus TaxID=180344 RepID=A0A430AMP5_9ENTE|nr:purine-nucleoside phosphorylase [Vagococcus elongatus]RSU09369.1 purine-nucleoside phosphorylase [Vagococcus elongatus]
MSLKKQIEEAKDFILSKTSSKPEIGIILGSGLGSLADELENSTTIPYPQIPNFAKSQAEGHANELVIGELSGKTVIAMKGRFHYYEGFSPLEVTFPVHVMKALGITKLIVTNACGAVNTEFSPGDLMLITDHINLTANNPFIGTNDDTMGPRFIDVSEVYSKRLRKIATEIGESLEISLRQGVYAWWTGPAYETPAEVRMIRVLGADAVGMSTVPEALVARYYGIETLGISCLTNMATGILDQPLNHEEVIEVAARAKTSFISLIKNILAEV